MWPKHAQDPRTRWRPPVEINKVSFTRDGRVDVNFGGLCESRRHVRVAPKFTALQLTLACTGLITTPHILTPTRGRSESPRAWQKTIDGRDRRPPQPSYFSRPGVIFKGAVARMHALKQGFGAPTRAQGSSVLSARRVLAVCSCTHVPTSQRTRRRPRQPWMIGFRTSVG